MTEPNIHRHQARALPKTKYEGPILAGQRWQNRGTANHPQTVYTVLRYNGRSVKCSAEGSRHSAGRFYNIPEANFRGNFNLFAQAPGYDPAAPVDAPAPIAPPNTVEEAVRAEAVDLETLAFAAAQETTDKPLWPQNGVSHGAHLHLTPELLLDPPTPEGLNEQLAVIKQIRKEETLMLAPPAPQPQPRIEVVGPLPVPRPSEIPIHAIVNPLQSWIDQGQQLVAQLTTDLQGVDHARTELRGQLNILDVRYLMLEAQRDQAERAVLHAIALSEGRPPEPPPEPPSTPPSLNAILQEVAENDLARRRRQGRDGKLEQRVWVLRLFRQQGLVKITEIRDAFAAEYAMTLDKASKSISTALSKQAKDPAPDFPRIERTGTGTYVMSPTLPNRV